MCAAIHSTENYEHIILAPLNDEQRHAVMNVKGPTLILAGAGSGKTRALTHRIAYLLHMGVPASQILGVTFTNKAAAEMKDRIKILLDTLNAEGGREKSVMPIMGTFHSVCMRILRREMEQIERAKNFVIYDTDDQEKILTEVLKERRITPEVLKARTARSVISSWKSEGLRERDMHGQATDNYSKQLAEIYMHYQKKLHEANALDFDDLLLETERLFRTVPTVLDRYQEQWRFIHVDEYQDTNRIQYRLISLLSQKYRNICVIGDPDQSIYAFRGADIRNILQFQKEYTDATVIKLEQNYRSTQPILSAADNVIAVNPNRPKKQMWTKNTQGEKILLEEVSDEKREADRALAIAKKHRDEKIPLNDQAILYRTNAQSRVLEEACLRHGIPYRIVGGLKFYARKEVKDVLAYLLTIYNPSDGLSLARIINIPSRKIGALTIAKLQAYASQRTISLWQTLKHIEMVEGIHDATKHRLQSFVSLLEKYEALSRQIVVSDLMIQLLRDIKMEEYINEDETDESKSRWENVKEVVSVMHKYDTLPPHESLTSFLEEVALISEVDKLQEKESDALTLMTLHLCKGLEFRSVVIVGCEEGIFPHSMSQNDEKQLEEERRLMYVGMTRAKEHLALLYAQARMLYGRTQNNNRSRFVDDIPKELLQIRSEGNSNGYGWLETRKNRNNASWYMKKRQNDDIQWNQDMQEENDTKETHVDNMQEGQSIYHPSFGQGKISQRKGDMVDIAFESGTKKKFALSIAPLSIVE